MIRSVKGSATRRFLNGERSRFPGLDEARARRRLADIDAASSLNEISPLKSVGLHKLKGNRAGFWSIAVAGPWRIVFKFNDGHADEVEIVDYH